MELSILPSSILTLLPNLTVIVNLRHDTGRFLFYYYCFFSFSTLSRGTAQMFASFSISLPFIDIISDARRRIVWAIKLAKSFITPNSFRVVQYNAGGWKCAAMGYVLLTVGWATAVGRGSVSGRPSHKLSVSALFLFFLWSSLQCGFARFGDGTSAVLRDSGCSIRGAEAEKWA